MEIVPGAQTPSAPVGTMPPASDPSLATSNPLLTKIITRIRSITTAALALCLGLLGAVAEHAIEEGDQATIELVASLVDRDDLHLDEVSKQIPRNYPISEVWQRANKLFQERGADA